MQNQVVSMKKTSNSNNTTVFRVLRIVSLVVAVAGACCTEAAFWMYPERPDIRNICKIVTVVFILLYALLCRNRKEWGFAWIFFALVLASLADVLIVTSFYVGAGLFALAHICLIIMFCKKRRLSGRKWILWGVISAAVVAMVLILGSSKAWVSYGAAAYAPILLLMVFAAVGQPVILRNAAIIFLVSDLLLAVYNSLSKLFFIHIIYMGLFYAALLIFAGTCTRNSGANRTSEAKENS